MSVTWSAPCRLHFGLFHVPVEGLTHWPDGRPIRKYGGLGMMIDGPHVTVTATPAREFSAQGSLGKRSLAFAKMLPIAAPSSIEANGPLEHIGLGVGTALAMTTARALVGRALEDNLPLFLGRGNRSGIGIHGFHHGGFVLDDGKLETELPDIRERFHVPSDWRILLVRPAVPASWHGEAERTAFHRNRSAQEAIETTTRLLHLANDVVVPALKKADFNTFTTSLTEFNLVAGQPFADDQGGPYAGPIVAGVIESLLKWGVRGVGQSSWGPTVFAFASDESEARALLRKVETLPGLADARITAANNRGVRPVIPS